MNNGPLQSVTVWFSVVMVLAVFALATAVLLTDALSDRLYGNKRIFFIVLLYAYAAYRGFRLYRYFRGARHEADN
jgi:hypothetical protein